MIFLYLKHKNSSNISYKGKKLSKLIFEEKKNKNFFFRKNFSKNRKKMDGN